MTFWLVLGLVALASLVLVPELLLLRRRRVTSPWEALAWTSFWIALAITFGTWLYFAYEGAWFGLGEAVDAKVPDGRAAAMQFFAAYLVQKSLSVDNIVVIALILAYFRVPLEQQQRLLAWSLPVAVGMRGLAVAGGVLLIQAVPWTSYVFGVILVFSALRMLVQRAGKLDAESPLVRMMSQRWPLAEFDGGRFIGRRDGRRAPTPLLAALIMIGFANIVFAVDAVPAILAITREPLIVLAAILFALLGLHSLYFLLASIVERLFYMRLALVGVFLYVGVKMLLVNHVEIPAQLSLVLVSTLLVAGAAASALLRPPPGGRLESPFADEIEQFVTLTVKSARRIVVLVTGSTVLLVGVLMIVMPGPAILVIPAGLAILATEFVWARRMLARFQQEVRVLSGRAWRFFDRIRGRKRSGGDSGSSKDM